VFNSLVTFSVTVLRFLPFGFFLDGGVFGNGVPLPARSFFGLIIFGDFGGGGLPLLFLYSMFLYPPSLEV